MLNTEESFSLVVQDLIILKASKQYPEKIRQIKEQREKKNESITGTRDYVLEKERWKKLQEVSWSAG